MKFPNFTFEGGRGQTTTNFCFLFLNLESGSKNPTAGEFFSLVLRTYLCGFYV